MALNYTNTTSIYNFTLPSAWNETQSNGTSNQPSACGELMVDTVSIIYATFYVIVLILAVLGNSLVCIAVALSPRLRTNATNYFIVSLAVSDMGFAMFQAPIKISTKLNQGRFCFAKSVCWMYVLNDLITTPATIITLFAIAADRFYCIKRPFLYQQKMTKKKARYMVMLIWLSASTVASLFVFKWNNPTESPVLSVGCIVDNMYFYMMLNIVVILIPLVIMGLMYSMILRIAISQIRAIRENEVLLSRQDENDNRGKRFSKTSHRRTHRELRATGTLAIVYGAFVICWLPICLINIIWGIRKDLLFGPFQKFPEFFIIIFDILPMLSTAVNPIIYNFSNKQFRMAFKVVMYRLVGKSEILRRATVIKEFGVYGKKEKKFHDKVEMKDVANE